MRVLLFGPYPQDASQPGGGVETSFSNLVDGLATLDDLELRVVTFSSGARATREAEHGRVPVTYLPAPARFNNLTLYRASRRAFSDACRAFAPDVVHALDAIGYGFVALTSSGTTPVVVSVHGIVEEELRHYPAFRDRLRTRIARIPLQRYTIRRAPWVLQPSPYPRAHFGVAMRGMVETVANPISRGFFAAARRPEPGRLLFVGHVSPLKRVEDVVAATARVRAHVSHAHLRVVGPLGAASYVERLRSDVRRGGLEEAVTFAGAVAPAELVGEYAAADVFILASGQENSPMVIGEAMAGGVPVVATRVGGVDALVHDGETGFLADVGDVETIADRIRLLLEDGAMRARMSSAARQAAEERFLPENVAVRVREIYRRCLAAPGPASARATPRVRRDIGGGGA
jgi:glycosyltransferase involved in cell wall biosynthesis